MKKLHIKILLLFAFVSSCQLTDVLDQDPPNNLVPENVVKTESDAKAILNGVYSQIISFSNAYYYMYSELIPGALSGSMSTIGFGSAAEFATNSLLYENSHVENFWLIKYRVMDAANNTIKLVGELPDSEFTGNNKNEIIGELILYQI